MAETVGFALRAEPRMDTGFRSFGLFRIPSPMPLKSLAQ
jgi:hypothetical protein